MRQLIRAEFMKLRTTRAQPAILAAGLAAIVALLVSQFLNAGKVGAPSLGTTASMRQVLAAPGIGSFFLLVVAALGAAGEFHHHTATAVFLVTPQRPRVVAAKAFAYAALGLAYAAASLALVLGLTLPTLALRGVPVDLANAELALVLAGTLAALPLHAVLGVGIGALVRNQLAAVLLPILWLLVLENMLPAYGLSRLAAWLPGGAAAGLARAEIPGLLPMWAGGLLLLCYALAFTLVGAGMVARRDVA